MIPEGNINEIFSFGNIFLAIDSWTLMLIILIYKTFFGIPSARIVFLIQKTSIDMQKKSFFL